MSDHPTSRPSDLDTELEREIADALGDASIEQLMDPAASPAPPTPPPTPSAGPDAIEGTAAEPRDRDSHAPETRLGTIAGVRGDNVFVDFGGKDQGFCETSQFGPKPPRVGEHIEFIVERFVEDEGLYKLTLPGATTRADWKTLARGMTIEAMVTGMNTGGLELKVAGKRAFMPVSQIDLERTEDMTPFLNRKLRCKVVELDKRKRRIVLSRRAALLEEREAHRAELLKQIEVGQVREGTVRRIQPFGAFVELAPGIDGLVHVSDMSYSRVNNPGDLVQLGQVVQVEVMKISEGGGRIALSMKRTQTDPWEAVGARYPVGSDVTGTVTRTTDFGAFVELEPGVEGLIHISQLSTHRVNRVEQVAKAGQQVTARVVQFDPGRRRIGLSIRAMTEPEQAAAGEPSRDDMRRYVKGDKEARAMASLMSRFGDDGGLKGGIG